MGGEENKFLPIPLAIVCLSAGSTEGLSGWGILEPQELGGSPNLRGAL